MFDDPKKELQFLEEELLRSEEKDEEFERFYSEIYAEFGDHSQEDLLKDNPAAEQPQRPQRTPYTDDTRYVPAPPKKKGIKGLVILACLETLGIVGVVLWWVLKIL